MAYGWITTDPFKNISFRYEEVAPEYLDERELECQISRRLLPVLSNQKMNAYLKEIADLCGINKGLTTHSALHTFATTVTLSNSIPIEAVSEMLGHSSLQMTKRYAWVVDIYLGREMEKLEKKYQDRSIDRRELLGQISAN